MNERARVKIGSFGRAHGVRGELRFFSINPDSDLLAPGLRVYVPGAPDQLGELTVERARQTDKFDILAFAEIDDRDDAETLTNLDVEVDEEVFPEPEEGEVYQKDLVGLPVTLLESEEGPEVEIGDIAGFFGTGANDVMVVHLAEGGRLLVPVIDEAVAELTPDAGAVLFPLEHWAPEGTDI